MRVGVSLMEAGGLGAGSRIDVSTHPPTVHHVEYQLDPWVRDDLLACGPVVLVSERLTGQLQNAHVRGIELVPAHMLPADPDPPDFGEEPLPADAPEQYRWIKEQPVADPDLRIIHSDYVEISPRIAQIIRGAELPDAEIHELDNGGYADSDATAGERKATRAIVHGTHGPDGFDGLAVVEAHVDAADGAQATFATVSDALRWARAQADRVLVYALDETWSAGDVPHPPYDPLSDDALRRADAQALADRERGLQELLVHVAPRPWYLAVIGPETSLDLDDAERLVRALNGVHDLTRHSTAGGELTWLIETHATGPADIDLLSSRIAEALLTPDRVAHLEDGDTFTYGTGRTQESGLLEHLKLEQLLASHVYAPRGWRRM